MSFYALVSKKDITDGFTFSVTETTFHGIFESEEELLKAFYSLYETAPYDKDSFQYKEITPNSIVINSHFFELCKERE